MKPKPFSPLNHFTVPVAMSISFRGSSGARTSRAPRRLYDPIRRTPENKNAPEVGNQQAHTKYMGTTTATGIRLAQVQRDVMFACPRSRSAGRIPPRQGVFILDHR